METTITTTTAAETKALGRRLSSNLRGSENLCLIGELGSGKTAFTQGIAEGLGVARPVKSPTYTYLQEYQLPQRSTRLAHYDLYRLPDQVTEQDLHSLDLLERLGDADTIAVIEWADKLQAFWQERFQVISFSITSDGHRQITVPKRLLRQAVR